MKWPNRNYASELGREYQNEMREDVMVMIWMTRGWVGELDARLLLFIIPIEFTFVAKVD